MTIEELEAYKKLLVPDRSPAIYESFRYAYNKLKPQIETGVSLDSYALELLDKIVIWLALESVKEPKKSFSALAVTAKGLSLFYPGKAVVVSFDYDMEGKRSTVKYSIEELRYPVLLKGFSRHCVIARDGVLLAWEIQDETL